MSSKSPLSTLLDSTWFYVLALLGLLAAFVWTQVDVRRDLRPEGRREDIAKLAERDDLNVLYVLIDTLRADRLGCYGYDRPTSPTLDYFADSGVRFADHHSQSSWTKTSMASLWTGLYPNHVGVLRAQDALPEDARVPAEILKDAGYETIGIWRNGWIAPNFGFSQGFDVYANPASGTMPGGIRKNTRAGRVPSTDLEVVISTRDFLSSNHDRRFFLYLHLMDVHQYVCDDETAVFGHTYSDSYDNSILWTDRQVGAIVAEVERLGLRDRTVIVVVSDHGEAFGEHGAEGHARDLHVETTTTPWIMSLPFRIPGGVVIDHRTSNVDVWPTLLDMLGLEDLKQADGRSQLASLIGAGGGGPPRAEFAQLDQTWGRIRAKPKPTLAVQTGEFRMIRTVDDGDRLYNLREDPGEASDVSATQPGVAEELRSSLDAYSDMERIYESLPHVELNDMELRQLRALGYMVQ